MAEQITDESLAFLYRAAASRGPGKRPVRVVSREKLIANFQHLNAAASDEDDDDFQPDEISGSEEEEDENSEEATENELQNSGESEDERQIKTEPNQIENPSDIPTPSDQSKSGSICCLCLNQRFADQEVIQCDLCGVCVHEGCYGIADEDWTAAENGAESDSETLTEPWFCEPCLAGLNPRANGNVYCELCPIKGGAYKRTDTGRWVHLTCAFYTPKVTFGDVFHLSHVSLADVVASPSRQRQRVSGGLSSGGAVVKPCAFCVDRLAARTGVPVKCDAGLCKQHAHIICAQRRGLLVDSSACGYGDNTSDSLGGSTKKSMSGPELSTVADPYYWCCPVHSDRSAVHLKKRMQAKVEANDTAYKPRCLTERERDKLASRRSQFRSVLAQRNRSSDVSAAVDQGEDDAAADERPPRLLSTSFELLDKMRAKTVAETGGADDIDVDGNISASANRRWTDDFRVDFHPSLVNKFSVPPAFATDFVVYYGARERQLMPSLRAQVRRLSGETQRLTAEQEALLNDGELQEAQHKYEELLSWNKAHYSKLSRFCDVLNALNCKNVRKPTSQPGRRLSVVVKPPSLKKNVPKSSLESDSNTPQTPSQLNNQKSPFAVKIYDCAKCRLSSDQHKLAFCDTCQKFYHLACLDPPLNKMPRKTPKFGWECSNCFRGSSSDSADSFSPKKDTPKNSMKNQRHSLVSAHENKISPRQLRLTHKPVKRLISEKGSLDEESANLSINRRRGRPRKDVVPKKRMKANEKLSAAPILKRQFSVPLPSSAFRAPKKRRSSSLNVGSQQSIDVVAMLKKYRQKTLLHKSRIAAQKSAQRKRPPTARKLLESMRKMRSAGVSNLNHKEADVGHTFVSEANSPPMAKKSFLPILESSNDKAKFSAKPVTKAIQASKNDPTLPVLTPFDEISTNDEFSEVDDEPSRADVKVKTLQPEQRSFKIRGSYTWQDLTQAVNLVVSKSMGPSRASAQFKIPRSTLLRHVEKANASKVRSVDHSGKSTKICTDVGKYVKNEKVENFGENFTSDVTTSLDDSSRRQGSVKDTMHTYSSPNKLHKYLGTLAQNFSGLSSAAPAKKSPCKNRNPEDNPDFHVIRVEDL